MFCEGVLVVNEIVLGVFLDFLFEIDFFEIGVELENEVVEMWIVKFLEEVFECVLLIFEGYLLDCLYGLLVWIGFFGLNIEESVFEEWGEVVVWYNFFVFVF